MSKKASKDKQRPQGESVNGAAREFAAPYGDPIPRHRADRVRRTLASAGRRVGGRAASAGDELRKAARGARPAVTRQAADAKRSALDHPVSSAIAGAYVLGFARGRRRRRNRHR